MNFFSNPTPIGIRMETHVECTAGSVLHASARRYAEKLGWPVFPCVPMRKVPATPNGFHLASSNPAQVDAWWSSNPNCDIGLPPGRAGYIVIDVDVKHGSPGMSTAAALGISDIPTLTAVTPNGGLHLYFTRPAGLDHVGNRHDLGAGLDVRADSGYVLVPPSVLGSGSRYTWRRRPPWSCLATSLHFWSRSQRLRHTRRIARTSVAMKGQTPPSPFVPRESAARDAGDAERHGIPRRCVVDA